MKKIVLFFLFLFVMLLGVFATEVTIGDGNSRNTLLFEDFGTETADWPVDGWTQARGIYPTIDGTTTQWYRDDWLNISGQANNAARINIYGTTRKGWLITPAVTIPADGYEIKFDLALTDYANSNPIEDPTSQADDKFIIAMSDSPDMSNPVALREYNNTGSEFVYNAIPHTGVEVTLFLTGVTGTKYFAFYGESTASGGDNDLFIDNVIIRDTPTTPQFFVSPASVDFGQVHLGASASQEFIVRNTGIGTLGISAISLPTNAHYSLSDLPTLPASLGVGEFITFSCVFEPASEGSHEAVISITDDLARVIHEVELEGIGFDATISELPATETWDGATVPNLPVGWSSIVNSTSTSAYVRTSTTSPNSAPNCVQMSNSADAEAQLFLISPPIADAIDLGSVRIRMMAKGETGHILQIGTMSNPADAATFSLAQDLAIASGWNEYVINLTDHTAAGQFIAIKHGLGATSRSLYVDDISFELIAPNDMAAVAISGNTTPSVGGAAVYTVSVLNNGTATQSNYQVKLFNAANVELGSVAGPTLTADQTADVEISWTPSAQGPDALYGKVVLAGDINPENDQTEPMNISVLPEGTMSVTIGEGDQTAYIPIDFWYKNSLFETIYTNSELNGFVGMVTGIKFYNSFNAAVDNKPIKIWLGTTTQTDLEAGWIPSTALTLVYDETVSYPTGENTISFEFDEPFMYLNGENLVMMVQRPMDTEYISSKYFKTQTVGTNRSRKLQSDSTTYDPMAPSAAGTLSGTFPKTTFIISAIPELPAFPHIQANLGEALPQIDLNEYFYQELEHSYYVENEGAFTYQISPEGILNLYPPLDWYGTQELLIGADYGGFFSYEQILKISILEVEVLAEDFDHAGVPPSGWSINHSGSTDYPWAPFAISGSNYAMQTRVNAGKTANERLLSTAYNLSELKDIEISFDSDLLLYPGGSASLAYSVNNITYNIVATYDSSHQGGQSFLLPALNGKPMVKFRWLYINGSVNIGQDNYWTIDDFTIHGVVADTDAPAPVTAFSLVETGADFATLSWNSSDDIYFERYELYISLDDEVNTEDQLWTVEQDAALAFASTTQTSISELLPATYWAAIRVVDQSANASALSAPIMFYVDVSAPLFSNPIPAGQPQPDWLDTSSVTIGCSIFDDTALDLSSIQYRVDFNGNGSYDESEGWTSLPARRARLSSRATETVELQIELPLDGIYKFEFKASDMNGNIGYSGMNNAEGIADDWQIIANPNEPDPIEVFSLVETGADFATLSWNSSDDIYFERYELYISLDDEVNTEDQLWTVEQDAALAFASTTQTSISELLPATYWAAIRVVDQSANASALSAPIMFYVDVSSPLFSNPIPAGQPQPDWLDTSSVTIGCSIFDDTALDLSSIQYRVDFNGSGSYDESEGWTSLPARRARLSSRATETVELQIELPLEGIYKFEFKASDMNGNIGYSGMNNAEGIADDWQIRLDLTAPEAISTFFVQSVLENSINLAWAASQDINFAGYRIFYSTDDAVDETDLCWDQSDDPALAEAGDGYITTCISGLSPATRYYFLLQAIDAFGHIAQYPQIISAMTTSSALPLAPQELSIQISEGIILLDWEDVSQDELGNEIVVSHYEVYFGESPDFVPDVNNMVTVELSELELPGVVEYLNGLFFRVVTVTGSIRQKAR